MAKTGYQNPGCNCPGILQGELDEVLTNMGHGRSKYLLLAFSLAMSATANADERSDAIKRIPPTPESPPSLWVGRSLTEAQALELGLHKGEAGWFFKDKTGVLIERGNSCSFREKNVAPSMHGRIPPVFGERSAEIPFSRVSGGSTGQRS